MLGQERTRALLRSRFEMREPVTGSSCRTLVASGPHVVVERIEGEWFRLRRLSPVECERLQGFADGWTELGLTEGGELVSLSDSRRCALLGNAVAELQGEVRFLPCRLAAQYPYRNYARGEGD